jgi:hypothetical protein
MSMLKNPIIISLIVSAVVFILMFYFYEPRMNDSKLDVKSDKNKTKKNNKKDKNRDASNKNKNNTNSSNIRETTLIVTAIAGLITWYIASSYFTEASTDNNTNVNNNANANANANTTHSNTNGNTNDNVNLSNLKTLKQSIPLTIQNDFDILGGDNNTTNNTTNNNNNNGNNTLSYNHLTPGLNIPKSALKLPKIMVDYK